MSASIGRHEVILGLTGGVALLLIGVGCLAWLVLSPSDAPFLSARYFAEFAHGWILCSIGFPALVLGTYLLTGLAAACVWRWQHDRRQQGHLSARERRAARRGWKDYRITTVFEGHWEGRGPWNWPFLEFSFGPPKLRVHHSDIDVQTRWGVFHRDDVAHARRLLKRHKPTNWRTTLEGPAPGHLHLRERTPATHLEFRCLLEPSAAEAVRRLPFVTAVQPNSPSTQQSDRTIG